MDMKIAEDSRASDAQLDAAFQTLIGKANPEEPGQTVATVAAEPVKTEAVAGAIEQSPQAEPEPVVETVAESAAENADVESLRAQLETARQERDGFADKAAKSLEWSRSGYLKKASEADRAKTYLKQIAEGKELDRAEIERFLAGAPQDQAAPVFQSPVNYFQPVQTVDDATLMDINRFTFKNRLGDDAAQKFIDWTNDSTSGLTQDDLVPGDTFHTLELMYGKYLRAMSPASTPSAATIRAAKTIQTVQKQAARAAGAISPRAKPAPEPEAKEDLLHLAATDAEGFKKRVNISDLIAKVMEQR